MGIPGHTNGTESRLALELPHLIPTHGLTAVRSVLPPPPFVWAIRGKSPVVARPCERPSRSRESMHGSGWRLNRDDSALPDGCPLNWHTAVLPWVRLNKTTQRQRTPGQAATQARPRHGSGARRAHSAKQTPIYSALLMGFQFGFRYSWLTRSQTGAFRPPHLRRSGFANDRSTRCGERQ